MLFKTLFGKSCLLIISLVTFYSQALSQDYRVEKITLEDGLSNSYITCLLQDSKGFLWVGTKDGLNRYDGYSFETYRFPITNHIAYLAEDHENNVWVLTNDVEQEHGLYYLDREQNKFIAYNYELDEPGASLLTVDPITKKVFIATYFSMYRINSKHDAPERVFTFSDGHYLFSTGVLAYSGQLWIGTKHDGIYQLNPSSGNITIHKIGDEVKSIWIDEFNNLWAITHAGIYQKNKHDSSQFNRVWALNDIGLNDQTNINFLEWNSVANAGRTSNNKFWINHDNSGLILGEIDQNIIDLSKEKISYVNCLTISTDQLIWIGTAQGLYKVDPILDPVEKLLGGPANVRSIRGLEEDDQGRVFIGSYGGFHVWNPKDKTFDTLFVKQETMADGESKRYTSRKPIEGGFMAYEMLFENDKLYIAEEGRGLMWYYMKSQHLVNIKLPEGVILFSTTMLKENNNRLWIGSNHDIHSIQISDSTITQFRNRTYYNANHVWDLELDMDNNIWIGTDHGLFKMDKTTRKVTTLTDLGPDKKLNDTTVLALHFDKEHLWIGTRNGGLNHMDLSTGEVSSFTSQSHGLRNNVICSILQDDDGYLWLGSYNGLMRFDPKTHEVKSFSTVNGLTHNEFNHGSALKASDGRLYFGGVNGLNIFDPRALAATDIEETVMISDIRKYDGQTNQFRAIPTYGGLVELHYTDRNLSLQLALSDFRNVKENQFSYRLMGWDSTWYYLRNNRGINYSNLPSGSYQLEIRGRGSDGSWGSKHLTIPVRVSRAFYKQPWFIITALSAAIIIIYLAVQWYTRNLKRQKIQLEQLVKARTQRITEQKTQIEQQAEELRSLDQMKSRFFTNISHELRTPLTLISAPLKRLITRYEQVPPKKEELLSMQRNSNTLLSLVEEILDLSKFEANKLKIKESEVNFNYLIKRIYASFESYAQSRDMKFDLEFQPTNQTFILDVNKFEKILNNLLSNAFRYTADSGHIVLKVNTNSDIIHIEVVDNGRGIHQDDIERIFDRYYQSQKTGKIAEGGLGIGLAFSKALTALMDGQLTVESIFGQGSTFKLVIPKKTGKAFSSDEAQSVSIDSPSTGLTNRVAMTSLNQGEQASVLIVEDHPDMRTFIESVIAPHFKVQQARNGIQAINLLTSTHFLPDLILTDVMMPEMDGLQLLEKLRANPKWRTIPIIMLTARATQEDKIQALITGVDDYLTKPFHEEELLVRIKNLIDNKQQRQQLQKETIDTSANDLESWDTLWLQQAEAIVEREIANTKFKVSDWAYELAVSKSQLQRKIKLITGLTPEQFIREVRLQKARFLLESRSFPTISEVSYAIGFDTPEYFSKLYFQRFGKRPSSYLKTHPH